MSILYAAIYQFQSSDNPVLLGEGPKSSELSTTISKKVLPLCLFSSSSKTDDQKQAITHGPIQYSYVVSKQVIYVVAAEKGTKLRVLSDFLRVLEDKFTCVNDKKQPGRVSKFILACVKQYNTDPTKMDKIAQMEEKIETVKDSMMNNIDEVLKRGERVEKLQGDTGELEDITADFKKNTRSVKRRQVGNSCQIL